MTVGGELLENSAAVGATGARCARFWIRAARPGRFELKMRSDSGELAGVFELPDAKETDFTTSLEYPRDFAGARPLAPGACHRWEIRRAGEETVVAEGGFETAPESVERAPDEMSFAVMSCHQPFDEHGELCPERLELLRAAERAFEQHGVKRVLMLGDQIYSDQPRNCSLFDPSWFRMIGPRGRPSILECPRHEVRQLFQQRYRAFWSMPELQLIMQRWPSCLMIDDHDISQNFGSRIEHGAAIWRSLREGALDAAHDYQGLRVHPREQTRPRSFHFQLEYGPVAIFVMDLRSQRGWLNGRYQVYGDDQHRDLANFLEANRERAVVLLGISVPLVHVPDWSSEELEDRWDAPNARPQRDRLIHLLREHARRCPEQRLILISGALHVGLASRIQWDDRSAASLHQLVASAVSDEIEPVAARAHPRVEGRFPDARVELLHRPGMLNPYDGLNIGLVKVLRDRASWKVKLLLLGRDKVVFESEPL